MTFFDAMQFRKPFKRLCWDGWLHYDAQGMLSYLVAGRVQPWEGGYYIPNIDDMDADDWVVSRSPEHEYIGHYKKVKGDKQ